MHDHTARRRSRLLLSLLLGTLSISSVLAAEHRAATPPEAARLLLAELVAHDTSLGRGGVPAVAHDLASRFEAAGFPPSDITVVPVGDTAALVVRYRGDGSGGRPIDLLAHLDVVAARAEDWGRDPFTLSERNGYLVGRGTLDVKGEIALLVTTLIDLRAQGFVPTRDLILVLTGDEETTGLTAEELLSHHRELVDAEYALNADNLGGGTLSETDGRPLLFRVQGSEKASARFELRTRNPGGHSSQPRADNAIYALADAIKAVEALHFPVMWNEWTIGDFAGTADVMEGPLGEAMRRFAREPGEGAVAERISEDSTFIGRIRTTCVATMLQGGHAVNALPQSASATLSCRIFPGESMQDVHSRLQKAVGPDVMVIDGPPIAAAAASALRPDVMDAVRVAIDATHPGARVIPTQSSYATDGSSFRLAGIPTYGVGGLFIKESEQFAHGLNERIPVASFDAGLAYWRTLITRLAGRP
jgi:acetylornithine deacetylase/succinyl-diaminopimelate desuccinylase-like protein